METRSDFDGYVLLACKIAKTRADNYRRLYKEYLVNPGNKGLMGALLKAEKKLRGPITNLDDDGIRGLQMQVERKLEEKIGSRVPR